MCFTSSLNEALALQNDAHVAVRVAATSGRIEQPSTKGEAPERPLKRYGVLQCVSLVALMSLLRTQAQEGDPICVHSRRCTDGRS